MRVGGEFNTDQGFAFRGRAQGPIGPVSLRITGNTNGKVSTDVRVGGLVGGTVGFTGDNITSVGASINLGRFASASISGQVGTSFSCAGSAGSE